MIEISVYLNTHAYAKKIRCFSQRVALVGVDVPYTRLLTTLCFMFGQQAFVEFLILCLCLIFLAILKLRLRLISL